MELNDNKAGMEGLDKEKINAIIRESTGTKYQAYQKKKDIKLQERLSAQKQLVDSLSQSKIEKAEQQMDLLVDQLEQERDLSRTIVHIDMDAFYAAVEMRDDPKLRHVPMAVGSTHMLSTSNYLARRFGVRAAMPGFIGRKLCPNLTILPCHFDKYTKISEQIRTILAEYDNCFAPMGLDEAYLDITDLVERRTTAASFERTCYSGSCDCWLPRVDESELQNISSKSETQCSKCTRKCIAAVDFVTFGNSAEEITREIRFRIEQKTGLTASAAKVCSDINKPNGQYKLSSTKEAVLDFVKDLPIRKIGGIGGISEAMLGGLGVTTCQDLYDKRAVISLVSSQLSAKFLLKVSLGLGCSFISSDRERKSISVERTFGEMSEPTDLHKLCVKLCQSLADDINHHQLKGKTVTLKLKTTSFDIKTRAHTSGSCHSTFDHIHPIAEDLLQYEIDQTKPQLLRLRLMGVRLSNLIFNENDDNEVSEYGHITKFLLKEPSTSEIKKHKNNDQATEDKNLPEKCDDKMPVENECESSETCQFECPVCQLKLPQIRTVEQMTEHVDNCLNRKAVSAILHNDAVESTSSSRSENGKKRKAYEKATNIETNKIKRLDSYFTKL